MSEFCELDCGNEILRLIIDDFAKPLLAGEDDHRFPCSNGVDECTYSTIRDHYACLLDKRPKIVTPDKGEGLCVLWSEACSPDLDDNALFGCRGKSVDRSEQPIERSGRVANRDEYQSTDPQYAVRDFP